MTEKKTDLTKYEGIKNKIDKALPEIARALPKHLSPERLARTALTSIVNNPKLQQCSPLSILDAIAQAAQCGLEVGGPLGQCWLIPYGSTATLQLGYKGVLALVWRSNIIKGVSAECVYKGDDFDYELGSSPRISHRPNMSDPGRESKPVEYVYVVIDTTLGGQLLKVMGRGQIEKHAKRYSQAVKSKKKDSPWNDPLGWEWMAKKTVLLQAVKPIELSPEIRSLITTAEAAVYEDESRNDTASNGSVIDGKLLDQLVPDQAADEQAAEEPKEPKRLDEPQEPELTGGPDAHWERHVDACTTGADIVERVKELESYPNLDAETREYYLGVIRDRQDAIEAMEDSALAADRKTV